MTVYVSATLEPFLEQVRASNLTASAKTTAGQLAADAVALSAKVQALEAELRKLQQQRRQRNRQPALQQKTRMG